MKTFRLGVGDAVALMATLPEASIDLIITDPPYESLEKHRSKGTTTRLKKSGGSSNEWFPIFPNSRFDEFFAQAYRVLKKDAHLYLYCDHETAFAVKPKGEVAGFKFWKPLVWGKTRQGMEPDADELSIDHQSIGMGYHYRAAYEFVLFFEKGKRRLNDLGIRDLLPFPSIRNGYPTEKPVGLNRVLVSQSSVEGQVVLDPFMGSGSSGVAAVQLGRDFIGFDIQQKSLDHTTPRLIIAGGTSADEPVFAAISGHLDEVTMDGDGPTIEPEMDGDFSIGPLPGGPQHLPKPEIAAPSRPLTCQHGDLRSSCVLCRSRR